MNDFNVLLVDDEADFLAALVKRLKKRNLNVRTAGTGEEALAIVVNDAEIDVVVLDVRMPGMDGIQVLQKIKNMNPLIEVIMLTGHASIEAAVRGMELGAFDYLMKPMNFDELYYKLQDARQNKVIQEKKIASLKA